MSKRENRQSGYFRIVVMVAVSAAVSAGAIMLMPANANPKTDAAGVYAGPTDYFPAQYVNQASEIVPMPAMYE